MTPLLGTLDFGPVRIAAGSMGYKHRAMNDETARRALGEPGFLLKIIPHVDGTPRICEIVRFRLGDIALKGAWTGPAALQLHPHALAPLSDLPVLEVISGVHLIADLTLDLGDVVHLALCVSPLGDPRDSRRRVLEGGATTQVVCLGFERSLGHGFSVQSALAKMNVRELTVRVVEFHFHCPSVPNAV